MKWELANGKVNLLNSTVAGTPVLTETKTPQLSKERATTRSQGLGVERTLPGDDRDVRPSAEG